MSSIRTKDMLYDALDTELAWRKQEITTFNVLAGGKREHQIAAIRRAGVALLYAHWEGFVKRSGEFYVEYVAYQRLKYEQLSPCFLALAMKAELTLAAETKQSAILVRVAKTFSTGMNSDAKLIWDGAVKTKSNLSAERLRDIVAALGLDYEPFELAEKTFVDKIRDDRNNIAHGKYFPVDSTVYDEYSKKAIEMMETFKAQIETSVASDAHCRKP